MILLLNVFTNICHRIYSLYNGSGKTTDVISGRLAQAVIENLTASRARVNQLAISGTEISCRDLVISHRRIQP
ncbi:hypothetical protein T05_10139 [Trichinella murrelli]|uniref:Uncharacterized protein n=1 Tax=Trichinella murrelli TaxID=144512 RepID=A0A0V0TKB2_9BILA|nr:hypothetical protein T05_10139 [Trichinella murrelli]